MSESKAQTYMGVTIHPASYEESRRAGYRWWVAIVHETGIPYGEMDSERYRSLADAKAAIRAARETR